MSSEVGIWPPARRGVWAYAPEGMGKVEFGMRNGECGSGKVEFEIPFALCLKPFKSFSYHRVSGIQ